MSDDFKAIMKSMSGRFVSKAIHTFDRATMVVVSVCWGAAILMIMFALYAVSLSASTRRAYEAAAASEPILPKIARKPMDVRDVKPLVDRLQHRYPGISFTIGNDNSIAISSTDGAKFHDWLNVVRYVDIASPKYRWIIKELCVGRCTGALMRAQMVGEVVTFEAPESGDKH